MVRTEIKFNAEGKPKAISKKNIKKARKTAEKSKAAVKVQSSIKNKMIKDVEVEVRVVGIMIVGDCNQLGPLQTSKEA